ncbi:MAG: hypothetical protein ACC628_06515 [Pirellulaceae bacterium]
MTLRENRLRRLALSILAPASPSALHPYMPPPGDYILPRSVVAADF